MPYYSTCRKFGPAPPYVNDPQWYTLPGVTFGTLAVGGDSVAYAEFTLTDGQLGDGTGVDGLIVDPGGAALSEEMIPTLSEWGLMILMAILTGASLLVIQRRKLGDF